MTRLSEGRTTSDLDIDYRVRDIAAMVRQHDAIPASNLTDRSVLLPYWGAGRRVMDTLTFLDRVFGKTFFSWRHPTPRPTV